MARLYTQTLKNYRDINSFDESSEWNVRENEENILYFRLIDLDQDKLRYISKAAALAVTVTFPNIDDDEEFTVAASNPDVDDLSIFTITIPAGSTPASGNFTVSVTEDAKVRSFSVLSGISVDLLNGGSC